MLTYWTKTLIPTLREAPAEAEAPSHKLLLRAGYLRKLASGLYDYLPLGLRSLQKATAIVREEMDDAGAAEVLLPGLQPIELWERTGRRAAYGENLFVVKDRHGRELALGPTHEEVITSLMGAYIESYKDLPKTLYQIQTKFRDEFRPRFGILRSREFLMKDAYSFDLDLAGLDRSYQAMYDAYCRIFERCGLPYQIVEAESGPIGGSASHEFMAVSPTGEDVILSSDKGNYAANVEKCEIGSREISEAFAPFSAATCRVLPTSPPTGEFEKIHTPNCASIEDVTAFFKKELKTRLKPENMLKTLVFEASYAISVRPAIINGEIVTEISREYVANVVTVVRGDHKVNETKLVNVLENSIVNKSPNKTLIVELLVELLSHTHPPLPIGYLGPHYFAESLSNQSDPVLLIVDPDAARDGFWVTGANKKGYHVKHFNWKRDVLDKLGEPASAGGNSAPRIVIADIRNAVEGDPSPKNDGGILHETHGIELGHVFKLGTKYTDALEVKALDENNQRVDVLMGCYGIGINRILAAAIEREGGHDENGIIWPASLAPYDVLITPIKYDPGSRVRDVVNELARALGQDMPAKAGTPETCEGFDVLIDDRDERPGVKFKDADLIGIPLRITLGDKSLEKGVVEMKLRDGSTGPKGEEVPVEQAVARAVELLTSRRS